MEKFQLCVLTVETFQLTLWNSLFTLKTLSGSFNFHPKKKKLFIFCFLHSASHFQFFSMADAICRRFLHSDIVDKPSWMLELRTFPFIFTFMLLLLASPLSSACFWRKQHEFESQLTYSTSRILYDTFRFLSVRAKTEKKMEFRWNTRPPFFEKEIAIVVSLMWQIQAGIIYNAISYDAQTNIHTILTIAKNLKV